MRHTRIGESVRPVLFTILGIDVQSYGVSKAAAALVAAWLLGRAFERRGLKKDSAHALVLWATVWGFVGAKVYYLLEQYPAITVHDLGGMGFTWYGGLVGGRHCGPGRHQAPPAAGRRRRWGGRRTSDGGVRHRTAGLLRQW